MKLKTALKIGLECGLTNVEEALYNIRIHSMNIFKYEEETKELMELADDLKQYEFNHDTLIEEALKQIDQK